MQHTFLFFNQIFIDFFPSYEDDDEPDEIDDIDNDDGEKLSKEVDIGVVEVKSYWSVLDDVAHPLVLNSFTMNRYEEV